MVNQDFCMEEIVLLPNSLEGSIMETMYNAFWDHLKDQLSIKAVSNQIPICILLSLLLLRQNCLRNKVEEALDIDLLKQEAEHGVLDVPHLSNYILNLMILLCAPV
uniref:Uncharacterized protein n=2 Tax=Sus scrofa TaxID=9823 RepID=A0A4X1W6F0_PIG